MKSRSWKIRNHIFLIHFVAPQVGLLRQFILCFSDMSLAARNVLDSSKMLNFIQQCVCVGFVVVVRIFFNTAHSLRCAHLRVCFLKEFLMCHTLDVITLDVSSF